MTKKVNRSRSRRVTKNAKEFGKAVVGLCAPEAAAIINLVEKGQKLLKSIK